MYDTLERLMIDRNISKEMVSKAIEKPLNQVEDKMKRRTPWLWEECLTVQRTFFPDVDIVELFTFDKANIQTEE